jgi:hypothetical protein
MIAAEELQAIRGRAQAFAYSWAGESSEQQGIVMLTFVGRAEAAS